MNKVDKALQALDGMGDIARVEMLVTGDYVENEVTNPRLAERGAICGGRKHCAIGSLWAGGRVRYSSTSFSTLSKRRSSDA